MALPTTRCAFCDVVFLAGFLTAARLPPKNVFYTGSDPDSCTGIDSLITSKGYPFENHSVTTSDGYIIDIHRIPHGRDPCTKGACHRHPVLLMCGLLSDSSTWVLDFPKQSLGFVLADHQYDVWLGNVRGNTHGKRHQNFKVQSPAFWNFSFHEHSLLDLPAQIDYVLRATGRETIIYVGVSQGTLMLFTLLSERPEYNRKVNVFAGLAPFNKLSHMDVAPLSAIAPAAKMVMGSSYERLLFGLLARGSFPTPFLKTFCAFPTRSICSSVGDSVYNVGSKYINESRLPVYFCHVPAGTSMKNVIHFAQLVTSKKPQMFDYGPEKNMEVYGQKEPRLYNIDNVKIDVGVFWSRGDQFVPPDNVRELLHDLGPCVKISHFIDDPDYTHLNFNIGIHNDAVLYRVLVPFLDKYASGF